MAAAGDERVPSPVPSVRMKPGKQQRPSRIPSVGDLVDRKEDKWTVFSGSQNLPTALNDPNNRELDLFTRTWGGSFVPTAPLPPCPFPAIQVRDFLRYLKETSAGRKVHRAILRQLEAEESGSCWTPTSPGEIPPLISQLQQDGKNYDLTCVPRIFMQKDFSLEDPPTFLEVLPLTQLLPKRKHASHNRGADSAEKDTSRQSAEGDQVSGGIEGDQTGVGMEGGGGIEGGVGMEGGAGMEGSSRHQSLKLLHEKLTHYLDVTEVHLAYEISQRSDVFFSTLSSQQELQLHIMEVRQEVMEVRHTLRHVTSNSLQGGLQLFKKCRRHRHYQTAHDKLRLISTVQQAQPTIQSLLRKSDFVGALELITTTQEVLQEHLYGIHALRHLSSQLAEMENVIGKMMEADLIEFAVQDIRHRLELCRDASSAENGGSESEEHLALVVLGLLRQGKLHFLVALRESLLAFLKAKVKGIVSGYLQSQNLEQETSSLAECMRGMEFEGWLDMLTEVFARMLQCQNAVQGCVGVIADVCAGAGGMQASDSVLIIPDQPVNPATPPSYLPPSHLPTGVSSHLPTGVPSHPALLTSPPAHVSPCFGPITPLTGVGGGVISGGVISGGVVGNHFEVSDLAQEAEDRLAQLMMDDDLSDARMGDLSDPRMGDLSDPRMGDLSDTRMSDLSDPRMGDLCDARMSEERSESHLEPESLASPPEWDEGPPEGPPEEGRIVGGSAMDQNNMATSSMSTQDPQEPQRLHHSRSVDKHILSVAECERLLLECRSVTIAACQLVHARCAKILDIRARAGLLDGLVPTDCLLLVHHVEKFVRCSAAITGIQCPHLRIALQVQAKNFLENFHQNCKRKISLLLESERWKQVEVPGEIQGLVNRLETGIGIPGVDPRPSHSDPPSHLPPTKFLIIHGNSFAVVGIVQVLVKELVQYCHYADSLPVLINEVMTKLIDIIKFFNTRTCDLVLGAGVVDAVGLKRITARHLAIMMRCLQAVCLLIPDLCAHFEHRLEPQQHVLLLQFDNVLMDFSSHCDQIRSKFMGMMDEVIQRNLVKWEVKQPIPSLTFKTITRKIVQLHDNLVDILSPQDLGALFADIEVTFRSRLKEHLNKLNITNNGSTKHGIVNLELRHCAGVLSSLDNISAFGSSLFDVWSSQEHYPHFISLQ